MSEYQHQEYPKMLYRPGNEKSQEIWGHRLNALIVNSLSEEQEAFKQGWSNIDEAIKFYKIKQKLLSIWYFYLKHWQWLWGTVIAILLAVFFGR